MLKFLVFVLCILVTGCFRPDCDVEGAYGECIVHYVGQDDMINSVDKSLLLFADNLQTVLNNTDLVSVDTILVAVCATPEHIKKSLHRLNIIFVPAPFACISNGETGFCLGTEWQGEVIISAPDKLSDTALYHELLHWVDELCWVDIDYHHVRDDWWGVPRKLNKILKENGL